MQCVLEKYDADRVKRRITFRIQTALNLQLDRSIFALGHLDAAKRTKMETARVKQSKIHKSKEEEE
jgi:hypothetical protein